MQTCVDVQVVECQYQVRIHYPIETVVPLAVELRVVISGGARVRDKPAAQRPQIDVQLVRVAVRAIRTVVEKETDRPAPVRAAQNAVADAEEVDAVPFERRHLLVRPAVVEDGGRRGRDSADRRTPKGRSRGR